MLQLQAFLLFLGLGFGLGGQAQNLAAIGGKVEKLVRPLDDVPNALVEFLQQALFRHHLALFEDQGVEVAQLQGPGEERPLPPLQAAARVKRQPAGGDRGGEVPERLNHTLFMSTLSDGRTPVLLPIGDHRPTIIAPLFDDVDLVPAAGAVFLQPYLLGVGIQGQALGIAVAIAPNRRFFKGIVGGNTPIHFEAQKFAMVDTQILGLVPLPPIPHGHIEMPLEMEDAGAKVSLAGIEGVGDKNFPHTVEFIFTNHGPGEGGGVTEAPGFFGPGEIDFLIVNHDCKMAS